MPPYPPLKPSMNMIKEKELKELVFHCGLGLKVYKIPNYLLYPWQLVVHCIHIIMITSSGGRD